MHRRPTVALLLFLAAVPVFSRNSLYSTLGSGADSRNPLAELSKEDGALASTLATPGELLPETPAAVFGSGSLGGDAYLAPDLFRPHARPLVKTKLCMRCSQRVTARAFAVAAEARTARARLHAAADSARARAEAAASESVRAAAAAATGDPGRGTDPFDPVRLATERAQDRCLALPEPMRAPCFADIHAPSLPLPDTATHAEFLELAGGGTAAPEDPAGASSGAALILASLPICVNEGSRQFVYSLFRGIVGTMGTVECVDIPANEAAAGALS